MCGIAGVRRFGEEPITEHMIQALLLALEHRGPHATGIAMIEDDRMSWWKIDEPAWKAVSNKGFKDYLKENLKPTTDTVILHDRAATVGSPRILNNNHPLTQGVSAIVHNGGITNDDLVFKNLGIERKAETDSDVIRGIIDKYGITKDAVRPLNRMSGSCAAACISVNYPGKLMLMRSGSPLVYATTESGLLMWASEKRALHHAQRQWEERYGIWVQANRVDMKWATMPDNTLYIFGKDGLEWHEEFKTAYNYVAPRYRCYDTYFERQAEWDKDAEKEKAKAKEASKKQPAKDHATSIACGECKYVASWPEKHWDCEPWEMVCPKCKKHMAEKPIKVN